MNLYFLKLAQRTINIMRNYNDNIIQIDSSYEIN